MGTSVRNDAPRLRSEIAAVELLRLRPVDDTQDRWCLPCQAEAINRLRGAGLRLGLPELSASLKASIALRRTRKLGFTLRGTSYTTDVIIDELQEATDDIERVTAMIRALERQLAPFR